VNRLVNRLVKAVQPFSFHISVRLQIYPQRVFRIVRFLLNDLASQRFALPRNASFYAAIVFQNVNGHITIISDCCLYDLENVVKISCKISVAENFPAYNSDI